MPWTAGDYPASMKNLDPKVRRKAIEIANAVLEETGDEGKAISIGISKAKDMKAAADHEPSIREMTLAAADETGEPTQRSVPHPTGGTRAFAPGPPA